MGHRRIPLKSDTEPTDSILAKPVEAETDLHGLDARSAEDASLLPDGGAVLKPLVRDLLDGRLARYVQRYTIEPGGGACLVQLGS